MRNLFPSLIWFYTQMERFVQFQHTAPQHRQYLSYDGAGMGSPGQRERQHQQSRATKAYGKVWSSKYLYFT